MTSLISFSLRRAQETRGNGHVRQNHPTRRHEFDPWNLGVSTSTSSVESIARQTSSDETHSCTIERVRTIPSPSTPEGLRPRKSIHRIRQELNSRRKVSSIYRACEPPVDISANFADVQESVPAASCFPASFSCGQGGLPPILQCTRESSPQISNSSFYTQSMEDDIDDYDDNDIVSLANSPSQRRRRQQQVAVSPDLERGKAKTAVGALLVALSESGEPQQHNLQASSKTPGKISSALNGSSIHSILPPREWMDDQDDEDDTIRDDVHQEEDGNENESSLHVSPSSNRWRQNAFTSWKDRQALFQQDTSFTRGFLSTDPNSSWQHENPGDGRPYDFEPIFADENIVNENKAGAPHILALINDNGGLNVSGISSSNHQRDLLSLHSLADTMDDENEDEQYNEEPLRNYQPLVDELGDHQNDYAYDKALVLVKAHNQRRIKEDLLFSTLERLQDDFDLVKEIYNLVNKKGGTHPQSLFLGMDKANRDISYHHLNSLLTRQGEMTQESSHGMYEAKQLSLRFFLSLLQILSTPFCENLSDEARTKEVPLYTPNMPNHRWKPLPGFRAMLGLEEEPQTPPSVRGGDTSLFSLPSDSAYDNNDNTPHTSNVSMTTTITTILTPERNSFRRFYQNRLQQNWKQDEPPTSGLRKTMESIALLLGRMENACLLAQNMKGDQHQAIEEITRIYIEFLNLSVIDLKKIIESFELTSVGPSFTYMARVVSQDPEVDDVSNRSENFPSRSSVDMPMARTSAADALVKQTRNLSQEILRINIVESEGGEEGQKVECDLWIPTSDTTNSRGYIPLSDEGDNTIENSQSGTMENATESADDLRRTVGSFDLENVPEEREGAPSVNENDHDGLVVGNVPLRPSIFARGNGGRQQPSRKGRFWRRKFLAPMKGSRASAE